MIGVKICGLCRSDDAALAQDSGATYGGVILAEHTRRSQTFASARQIFAAAPQLKRVGVFVDATPDSMLELVRELGLDAVQLHGAESVDVVKELSVVVNVWKAVRVRTAGDVQRALELYGPFVSALLLDGFDSAQAGGSGKSFAWDAIVPVRAGWPSSPALVLAGGLTPDNVARAVGLLAPDIVDVSSGVEEAVGRKSAERVAAFVAAARGALNAERPT